MKSYIIVSLITYAILHWIFGVGTFTTILIAIPIWFIYKLMAISYSAVHAVQGSKPTIEIAEKKTTARKIPATYEQEEESNVTGQWKTNIDGEYMESAIELKEREPEKLEMLIRLIETTKKIIQLKASEAESSEQNELDELSMLRSEAEAGDCSSQLKLGKMLMDGIGATKNENEARKWLQSAAEQGEEEAQCLLNFIDKWPKLSGNKKLLYEYLMTDSDAGDSDAKLILGMSFEGDQGISHDQAVRLEYIKEAADKRNPIAQYLLAHRYFDGEGLGKNQNKAREWLLNAAQGGYFKAQYQIAFDKEFSSDLRLKMKKNIAKYGDYESLYSLLDSDINIKYSGFTDSELLEMAELFVLAGSAGVAVAQNIKKKRFLKAFVYFSTMDDYYKRLYFGNTIETLTSVNEKYSTFRGAYEFFMNNANRFDWKYAKEIIEEIKHKRRQLIAEEPQESDDMTVYWFKNRGLRDKMPFYDYLTMCQNDKIKKITAFLNGIGEGEDINKYSALKRLELDQGFKLNPRTGSISAQSILDHGGWEELKKGWRAYTFRWQRSTSRYSVFINGWSDRLPDQVLVNVRRALIDLSVNGLTDFSINTDNVGIFTEVILKLAKFEGGNCETIQEKGTFTLLKRNATKDQVKAIVNTLNKINYIYKNRPGLYLRYEVGVEYNP